LSSSKPSLGTEDRSEEGALDSERALIIVPTYNERENIARLIETVLSQDPRLEILVVDDGSPDGTADIVKAIMGGNARVHIHQRAKKLGLGTGIGGITVGPTDSRLIEKTRNQPTH